MKKSCLIISSIYDFSIDLVIQELEKSKVDYIRLNKENIHKHQISIDPEKKTISITGNGINRKIKKIKSIWFRQPIFLRNTPEKSLSLEDQLSKSQWTAFLRGLMIFDDAFWMNWPANTYSSESKPYQLMIASKIGFKIPKTQISNSFNEAKSFQEKIIVKSLDTVLLRDGDDCLFTYTSSVKKSDLTYETIGSAPLIVQNYITNKTDIRVTIIKKHIFSVKITSNGYGIDDDWRLLKKDELEYTNIELPKKIKSKCYKLMVALGLNFGAIDLIESNGDYYFIEINPTGEWGWLSNEDRKIELCIAEALS
ncbi:hypothetical protein [Deefgea salmonis]|uniref:ATP-grasp fold RimK-type domain-containing protein n=1 Tax=Deefgea salmonis TaxID=2875502 RepID=A0ABS8BMF8_9NEIS|nr:hypothetical protein [Deefgea salmonis]MCB5196917.1 hypothetical protein [Deefgea salmonis]